MPNVITYKFRVKDSNVLNRLGKLAGSVNFVWNYVNETSAFAWKRDRRWLSGFDMCSLVAFTAKELGLHSHTIQAVAQEHAARRGKVKRSKLNWRSGKMIKVRSLDEFMRETFSDAFIEACELEYKLAQRDGQAFEARKRSETMRNLYWHRVTSDIYVCWGETRVKKGLFFGRKIKVRLEIHDIDSIPEGMPGAYELLTWNAATGQEDPPRFGFPSLVEAATEASRMYLLEKWQGENRDVFL